MLRKLMLCVFLCVQVVQNFGQSLLYGSQYIYQSMPRMLSLWLDYGAEAADTATDKSDTTRQGMKASLTQLNRLMASYSERLAPYQFFVVFPQLISRICHAHPDVFSQLKVIYLYYLNILYLHWLLSVKQYSTL